MVAKQRAALAVLGLAGTVGIIIGACGGSEGTPIAAGMPDAAPTTTSTPTTPPEMAPTAEAGAEAGPTPYTLDNICDKTAAAVCEIRKPCCAAQFDASGCLAHQQAVCALDVAAAKAGHATFHPERVDTCLPKLKEILSNCTFTFELLQKFGKDIAACAIFEGDVPVGGMCQRTSQCKPGTKKNEMPSCDDKTKKCKLLTFLKEGDACRLGDGFDELCESGLYCDIALNGPMAFKGVCKKSTSVGVMCDKNKKPVQLECGLGNYCDLGTSKCTVGRAGGVSCNGNNFECASVQCTDPDAGADAASPPGTCVPLGALTQPEECKGP